MRHTNIPSVSSLRWFKAPEDYLADYQPVRTRMELIPGGERCPKCGNTNPQKLDSVRIQGCYRPGDRWRCKRWFCRHTWPMEHRQITIRQTPEEYVFGSILQEYRGKKLMLDMGYAPDGFTEVKHGLGFWGSVALVGAMSDNWQTAKDGAVLGGFGIWQRHQRQQQASAEVLAFESDAERAWNMAREYFNVPEREAQVAKAEQDDSLRQMARVMAQEMVAEVRRQSA